MSRLIGLVSYEGEGWSPAAMMGLGVVVCYVFMGVTVFFCAVQIGKAIRDSRRDTDGIA